MTKNLFWAATHPAYYVDSQDYRCLCGHRCYHMKEHYQHVLDNEPVEVAEKILSWKQFEKYCKAKGIEEK